mmetsp:Transcript_8360/g.8523  ORF Transcript_8360/g.8523 Transcript_8360/m.8523 type:complete len:334 (-) Transcript_8360:147-1148(-)|eukprot:CAMPEP_0182416228 /NCGR_PEP_ID=MMETSP1167-20130531/456_1 /TAXON_ID=2988 /ORGANISM="Mallomonas Sp, Strain CCMP3275" /LENGTH=333 /DNA_ID=CAMNT_0024588811 /DNA_START=43 /DNA_END=1044 /DNA_ORIENTATION=-
MSRKVALTSLLRGTTFSRAFNARPSFRGNYVSAASLSTLLQFRKLQGAGNDFVIVDNTKSTVPKVSEKQVTALCDRNFGIGGDGVILAMPGSEGCHYTMRIFNRDGSEFQMCGNGIRCLAQFIKTAVEGKDKSAQVTYDIWTGAGKIVTTSNADGSITVDMGEPILQAERVPTLLKPNKVNDLKKEEMAMEVDLEAGGGKYKVTCVSMGNPHSVAFLDDIDKMNPKFEDVGGLVENHPMFPERVNAEFVQVLSRSHVRMKVWERGNGPTLACGTGSSAVVVASVLTGRVDRKCTVSNPGGDLLIHWDESNNHVYKTGPATEVFQGEVDLDELC